jgi:GT2 family glycosyltransferase
VLEDDTVPSPDILALFEQMIDLLDSDPSIWCISTWHDNAKKGSSRDLKRLFRTDVFPGLGWMLSRSGCSDAVFACGVIILSVDAVVGRIVSPLPSEFMGLVDEK